MKNKPDEAVDQPPGRLFVQLTPTGGTISYVIDPREVHDNGKPVYQFVRADLCATSPVGELTCRHCGQPIKAGKATGAWLHIVTGTHKCAGNTYQRAEANTSAQPAIMPVPPNDAVPVADAARKAAEEIHALCNELAPEISCDTTSYVPSVDSIVEIISKHLDKGEDR